MDRRLCQAAATLVVVCLAMGEIGASSEHAANRRVGPGSIAAGRAHTVMAMPDGRVFAWGDGTFGQIGDGAMIDRLSPTLVPGLTNVVSVTAGAAHTVAVTDTGEVYAWGANTFGRLGDGTRKRRATPVKVKGLSNVRMVAAGRAHTLALTGDGKVYAWGRNVEGQLGLGTKSAVQVPTEVRGLPGVIWIAAGDTHSLAVSNDGRVFAWGNNESSRLGDGTTKDRSKPVALALMDVVAVAAGGAHSLALTRSGAVYSWGRGTQGQLGTGSIKVASTPKEIPALRASAIAAGRNFSAAIQTDGRVVAWGANASGQLGDGTTVRRLRPVLVGNVDRAVNLALGAAHAIAVTASGDVRVWGEGESGRLGSGSTADAAAPIEIIGDVPSWGPDGEEPPAPADTTPPTITASTSPELSSEWITVPVTVSFTCGDDVAVASCPSPITVSTDGFAQRVTGTATDTSGNTASADVVINLDLRPPALQVTAPQAPATTDQEVAHVVVAATDASGVATAQCNGQPAAGTPARIECDVVLRPGRNEVVIDATDAVGHAASTAVTVNRVGTASRMTLSPAARTFEVNEVGSLSLLDDFGARVEQASWSSSDTSIVSLSDDDPPQLSARATGEVTIRVEKDGLIAEASIKVVPELATGDIRWSLPSTPDYSVESPLFTNRVDPSVPHMFTVETQDWGQALLRAVSDDGEVLWQEQSPGVPFMGDTFGGVIAGVLDASGSSFGSFARIAGGIAPPWRFVSQGTLEQPAQASDGTLYAIEYLPGPVTPDGQDSWDKYVVVIDGESGQLIRRTMLPREIDNFVSALNGTVLATTPPTVCTSVHYETAPDTIGPVVGSDGRGYFAVRRHHVESWADCNPPFRRRPDRTIDQGIDLYSFGRDGVPRIVDVFSSSCSGELGSTLPCDLPVRAYQVMPDGIGGTLVTWERGTQMVGNSVFVQRSMSRVDAESTVTERFVSPRFELELVGQNGLALSYGDNGYEAIDVVSGTAQWSNPLPHLTPLAARPDGGLASLDNSSGELVITNGAGEVETTQSFDLDWRAVHDGGDWVGLRGATVAAVAGNFSDATRFNPFDSSTRQQRVREPGIGIFGKDHLAYPTILNAVRFRHVSVRIAPRNWQHWIEQGVELRGTDEFGNGFFTLGAGSGSADTNASCSGILVSDLNRTADYLTPPWDPIEKLAYPPKAEDALIQALLDAQDAYPNDLLYACFPESNAGYYNSNSFAHGLLNAVGLHGPRFPERMPTLAPGWPTPVPESKFRRTSQ